MIFLIGCTDKETSNQYKLDIENKVVISEELSIEKIAEGVLLVSHEFPWDANSLIIEFKNGEILLIDTPYENNATQKIVEWIYEETEKKSKITAINTGYHFDNLGGNKYLKSQDIRIIGINKTSEMIDENGEAARDVFLDWLSNKNNQRFYDAYKNLEYVKPNDLIIMDENMITTLNFGNSQVELYFPGHSHAPDNITVYYKDQKILFGGCMIKGKGAKSLGNTNDANIEGWQSSIDRLLGLYSKSDIDFIIPGHGTVGDYDLLEDTLVLLKKEK